MNRPKELTYQEFFKIPTSRDEKNAFLLLSTEVCKHRLIFRPFYNV